MLGEVFCLDFFSSMELQIQIQVDMEQKPRNKSLES